MSDVIPLCRAQNDLTTGKFAGLREVCGKFWLDGSPKDPSTGELVSNAANC
jgi:hypothetical protein